MERPKQLDEFSLIFKGQFQKYRPVIMESYSITRHDMAKWVTKLYMLSAQLNQ